MIRGVSLYDLAPAFLEEHGLLAAIHSHCDRARRSRKVEISVSGTEPAGLDASRRDHLYRLYQEALRNALHHSHCTRIDVVLQKSDQGLMLVVKDNGRGVSDEERTESGSLGLVSMAERCATDRRAPRCSPLGGRRHFDMRVCPAHTMMDGKTLRIVIADDHRLFREGIRHLFSTVEEMDIVADLESGDELVATIAAMDADLALVDVSMPGPGVAVLRDQVEQADLRCAPDRPHDAL